ncbi:FAD-dependent oxidoreductase [Tepidanaerobacter sp. GT38]|uniref:oxidoreductase n=1 Tax=Tepidanaerobacter sp. GT38 TaxID=2722793 RepID=UPI001F1F0151|nr:FAD-dependent oxidoreductase [Tepidanaerobacter sp. GT38]MCG1012581.1 FAD-dependent oxidoreductase [Tepidanaerobacter sp. GT38]
MTSKYNNLFEPFKIGKLEIKNKFVMAPMGPGGLSNEDGAFNEKGVEYYVERAKGGTGLIITGICYVENEVEKKVMPSMPCPTLNPASFIKTAAQMTERVHAYDSKIFLQLTAGFGRVAIPAVLKGDAVAPSPIENFWNPKIKCRELTTEEVEYIVKKFAEASVIAKMSGFDGVEIHAVHEGYLLDQFTIALFNKRTDKYGNDLMGRLRFLIEIVKAIKKACGDDFPVSLRYSVKSYIKGIRQGGLYEEEFEELGRDTEEGLQVAKILEEAGYDAFNADAGTYDSWYWNHPPMYQRKGLYLHLTGKLKEVVKVPVLVAGRMEDPDLASSALEEGMADAIVIGRGLLADPQLPNKIKAEKLDDIRPCLCCHDGCMGRIAQIKPISCAVNPQAGREAVYGLTPAEKPKKVMVIGGGVAGMEAARVSALRGHEVSLYEKSDSLGGVVLAGGVPDFKEADLRLVSWYEKQLKDLMVNVNLNSEVTKDLVDKIHPDVVIVATGSVPKTLNVPGIDKAVEAVDVLRGKAKVGDRVVVVGGGLVGCELALWLAKQGKQVTIVEVMEKILSAGLPIPHMNSAMLKDLLAYYKVNIKTKASVASIKDDEVVIKTESGEETIPADSAVIAIGYNPKNDLYKEIARNYPETYLLGDARKVQNIMYAIWDAYEVARNI